MYLSKICEDKSTTLTTDGLTPPKAARTFTLKEKNYQDKIELSKSV
jgi:hypothetical protein